MKLMPVTLNLIVIVSCFCSYSFNSQEKFTINSKYKTWISTIKEENELKVTANFRNNTEVDLLVSYSMISNKSGRDGNSLTTQKGNIKMGKFRSTMLSRSSINFVKNDRYNFILTVYKNNEIIGKDSVEFYPN